MAQYTARYDIVQGGAAQHGIAQHGKVRYGTLREFNPQEREANGHDGTMQPRGTQERSELQWCAVQNRRAPKSGVCREIIECEAPQEQTHLDFSVQAV